MKGTEKRIRYVGWASPAETCVSAGAIGDVLGSPPSETLR